MAKELKTDQISFRIEPSRKQEIEKLLVKRGANRTTIADLFEPMVKELLKRAKSIK